MGLADPYNGRNGSTSLENVVIETKIKRAMVGVGEGWYDRLPGEKEGQRGRVSDRGGEGPFTQFHTT